MPALPETISSLVRQCQQGDAESFAPLVRHFQNAGYAIALSYVRDKYDAEDILQEAFISAYCKLGQLREPAKFGGWFHSIVVMHCKEWLRHRQLVRDHMSPLDRGSEQVLAYGAEQADRIAKKEIWEQVDLLPAHYRTVALLYYLSGFSYKEIAGFLKVPISTVKGRLQQSKIRLREALSSTELEGIEMNRVDVSEEVQELIYQIVTTPIQQTISLQETPNIVLYCGIGTDVEVRQGHGDEVVLEGTKATIGLSVDGARQDLSKIEILADQVEDFFESGPHEGEVFSGTSGDEKSTLTSFSTPTRRDWEERTHPSVYDRGRVEELFPSLKEQVHSLPEEIRKALRHATRISILRQRMADVVMPRQVYTPKLQKVFRANYIGSERVHGPIGSASLVVFVPPAKTVTVVGGREVHVSGLRGSVNLIGADKVELSDIEGTVYLFDCPLTSARRITGRLWQRFYRYGGCCFSDHPTTRVRRGDWESQIEEVNGEVDLEVGRVMLDLADLAGPVRIHNHYGTTRLSQNHFKGGTRFQLRTKSGEILLFLKRDLIEQVNMTVNTLCGVVNCEMLKPMLSRSTGLLITLSTMNSPQASDLVDADFYIQTESGGVTVEGMK